jgi:hypothetical protein
MRIISFPHASMHAFWSAPVQALAPWLQRIRLSLEPAASPSGNRHLAQPAPLRRMPCAAPASNDPVFRLTHQTAPLHTLSAATPAGALRSTLRIVRESDAAIRPDCAGRMVISGRMADVCAELDRMALQASAHTADA